MVLHLSRTCNICKHGSTGVEIQVVLHRIELRYNDETRSTGVEIQVVLHPWVDDFKDGFGSTGVEIQVVLHRNICKYQ